MPATRCVYCNRPDSRDNMHYVNCDYICNSCFNERYVLCNACGAAVYHDDAYNGDNNEQYCYHCYRETRYWEPSDPMPAESHGRLGTMRCFGVELETTNCPNYRTLKGTTCFGAKEDGSIDGIEFVSPILSGQQGLTEVRRFCRAALKNHFTTEDDCGYHLHIDMRDTTDTERQRIAYAYVLAFKHWADLVDPDRLDNNFCVPPDYTTADVLNCVHGRSTFTDWATSRSRYEFINWRAFRTHRTLEIRGHHGTVDPTEVCEWIVAHVRFVEFVKDKSFDELNKLFGFSRAKSRKSLRRIIGQPASRYYSKRWRKQLTMAETMLYL
jgi:hypothetical protein